MVDDSRTFRQSYEMAAQPHRPKPPRVWYGDEKTRQVTQTIKAKTGLSVAHIRRRAFQIGLEALLANPALAYNCL